MSMQVMLRMHQTTSLVQFVHEIISPLVSTLLGCRCNFIYTAPNPLALDSRNIGQHLMICMALFNLDLTILIDDNRRCGPMVDLCHGPHLPNTGYLKTQAVNNLSRAFWRADVNKDPLQVNHVDCIERACCCGFG